MLLLSSSSSSLLSSLSALDVVEIKSSPDSSSHRQGPTHILTASNDTLLKMWSFDGAKPCRTTKDRGGCGCGGT